ncbi:MAG: YbhB/YbcL family Raf kinase inhibitor-like protein [Ilumatobacteraceae bacterium]
MIHTARVTTLLALCSMTLVLSACSTDDGRTMAPPRADQTDTVQTATTVGEEVAEVVGTMTLTGPWASGDAIDSRYTCDGEALSPPLVWTGAPEDTQAYALVIDNMDDPMSHNWVVTNIDFAITNTAEGVAPAGAVVARNATGTREYSAPCPPRGTTHTFVATVYALDSLTPLDDDPDARTIVADIEAAALEAATTVFTVTR